MSKPVGWVERSDTHHFIATGLSSFKYVGATNQFIVEGDAMGFTRAQPIRAAWGGSKITSCCIDIEGDLLARGRADRVE